MKKFTLFFVALSMTTMSFGQMSGTYRVGVGQADPNFTSLNAAVTALNDVGISGNVVLEISSDLTESGSIVLDVLTDPWTITIKPAASVTPTVTFTDCTTDATAAQYTGFALNFTNFIIFDGSNTAGGTTRDMTFKMNDATNGKNVIQLYGNSDNITIKNLKILYQATPSVGTSRNRAISVQNVGADMVGDNLLVQNCQIGDAGDTNLQPFFGIYIEGAGAQCTDTKIENNDIYAAIKPIYMVYAENADVINNKISLYGNYKQDLWFTHFNTCTGTLNVENNTFDYAQITECWATTLFGVHVSGETTNDLNIINNFFKGVPSRFVNELDAPGFLYLTSIESNNKTNIYNNTYIHPTNYGVYFGQALVYINAAAPVVDIKNNIFVDETDNGNLALLIKVNSTGLTLTSDYNDFVSSGSGHLSVFNGTRCRTLADWQGVTGLDSHSVANSVSFVDKMAANLSLTGESIGDTELGAPMLPSVTTDKFGTTRGATTYMGAHEASSLVGIEKVIENPIIVLRTAMGIKVELTELSSVQLYNVNGMLIDRKELSGTYSRDLNGGIYIIKINGKAVKFMR